MIALQETKKELGLRKPFEDAIKRPYFHVKPLDQNQLAAWNSYIDYVLQKDDAGIIVRLFERCLVACASYPGPLANLSLCLCFLAQVLSSEIHPTFSVQDCALCNGTGMP